MLVGVLSDTHGHRQPARAAMKLFTRQGVEYVIHCGDVGGIEVFSELLALPCTFVWGNTDFPEQGVHAFLDSVGLPVPGDPPTRLTLEGKRFAVFHGHEPGFGRAANGVDVDYLLHGHTHVARDERIAGVRIINPGALHRAHPKSVATLDTQTDTLTFHEIDAA